jgi:putative oxidoreductase
MLATLRRIDAATARFFARSGITLLRVALGVTFIWFGALKVAGASPVADLLTQLMPFLPAGLVVPAIGTLEVLIGVGLLLRLALRLVLALFFLQMAGTFLVLVALPRESFQDGNPLLLTQTGEFVVKNLVLLSAGMVVGSTVRRGKEELPA